MLACEKGHDAIVDALLAHNADVNVKSVRVIVYTCMTMTYNIVYTAYKENIVCMHVSV